MQSVYVMFDDASYAVWGTLMLFCRQPFHTWVAASFDSVSSSDVWVCGVSCLCRHANLHVYNMAGGPAFLLPPNVCEQFIWHSVLLGTVFLVCVALCPA